MSCAYRTHRYRASVTAHPPSVSWQPPTGHAQHPISLRPPVVRPDQQAVTATADDAPIPVSLVQYLWAQWYGMTPAGRSAVVGVIGTLMQYLWAQWYGMTPAGRSAVVEVIGTLMLSPRWHWDVTVLPDQSLPDPQGSLVSSRDGRWTIGMPITMLRDLWRWVLGNTSQRAPILRWVASGITPSLWQKLRTHQRAHGRRLTEQDWYHLYGYLSPVLLPDIAQATRHLLSSTDPNDHRIALTVLDRWLASPDSATRDLAAQTLRAWLNQQAAASTTHDRLRLRALTMLSSSDTPAVVSERLYDLLRTEWNRIERDDVRMVINLLHGRGDGRLFATDRWMLLMAAMVRDHPSKKVIREVLDRLMPTIVPPDRPDDRVRWAATLWTLLTDPTLPDARRQTIATALTKMMQEPMVAALVHAQLCTEPSLHQTLHQTIPTPIRDTLLTSLIQTAHADTVLSMIAQEIRQNPNAIVRFDRILAAGWGHGHDHRILQIITAHPSPHWKTVLTEGITTSVGPEVRAIIQSRFPHDQAMDMILRYFRVREERGDWPLDLLPAYFIPWVCEAARSDPEHLPADTIRRLWLADPIRAWDVTQTMLDSDHPTAQHTALTAMDAGWGTGHDAEVATTLRTRILKRQNTLTNVTSGIATAISGIGIAPPSLIEALLTELAMKGNENVGRWLISALHRGWGRGQDDLVWRVVEIIADRDSSEWIWADAHETLLRAWDYHPPHVVVSLIDRLVTHAMNGLLASEANDKKRVGMVLMAKAAIAAFAPGWTHLPAAHMIERIAHHVAHLHAHAHTMPPTTRDTLVAAWASVVTAGAARLSASAIHALLDSLWILSPDGCLKGVAQWVDR